jgi:riboflavin synthase
MFTGIVEEIGAVRSLTIGGETCALTIEAVVVPCDLTVGASIAVNGVCLTVRSFDEKGFSADVMPETLRATNLGVLRAGSPVNLERAVVLGGRMGGHLVSGHVDGTGLISSRMKVGNAEILCIRFDPRLMNYVAMKGSIALDGTSLTVMELKADSFSVSLIPHTRTLSVIGRKRPGETVNVECDMIAKYVERLLGRDKTHGLDADLLDSCGFS